MKTITKDVYGVIANISEATGNDKLSVLRTLDDSPNIKNLLKKIVSFSYDPMMTYNTTKINPIQPSRNLFGSYRNNDLSIDTFFEKLEYLNEKGSCNSQDQYELDMIVSRLDSGEAQHIALLIINRDLDIGAGLTTFRKVWGDDFCPEYKLHKPTSFNEDKIEKHIIFPAISQLKSDGARCIVHYNGVDIESARSGNGHKIKASLVAEAVLYGINKLVDIRGIPARIDGELVAINEDGTLMDRAKGNGIINKAIQGTINSYEETLLRFVVWDWIPEIGINDKSQLPDYNDAIGTVERIVLASNNIRLVMCKYEIVKGLGEAKDHFLRLISIGEEGTVVKNLNSKWKNGRNPGQYKFKVECECELEVIATTNHSKKPELVGALVCKSSCGLLNVSLGSGLSASDRKKPDWIGCIVTGKFNNITKDKSLFLPRFVRTRPDKNVAQTFDEIVKKFNDTIGLDTSYKEE